MLLYQLKELDETNLNQVCNDQTSESLTLEFKRELPTKELQSKAEFLKDVTALANANGGDLVYGIEEKAGAAFKIHPIVITSVDSEKRRLGQILDAGAEPRITGIQFHEIEVKDGFVLILRIPQSFDGPHRVNYNNEERFFLRSGTHTSKMSYDQLKIAFDRTATLVEKVKAFRRERLSAIQLGQVPLPIMSGPLCVAHVIPLSSIIGRQLIDIVKLSQDPSEIIFRGTWQNTCKLNLDGIVAYNGITQSHPETYSYNQIYRTGCTESVFYGGTLNGDEQTKNNIPSTLITANLRNSIIKNINFLKNSNIAGPVIVGVSMLNVKGFTFAVGGNFSLFNNAIPDRNTLILPEVWMESLETLDDIDDVIKPMMDLLWQSFDLTRCYEYTAQGVWNPRN